MFESNKIEHFEYKGHYLTYDYTIGEDVSKLFYSPVYFTTIFDYIENLKNVAWEDIFFEGDECGVKITYIIKYSKEKIDKNKEEAKKKAIDTFEEDIRKAKQLLKKAGEYHIPNFSI